MFIKTKSKLRLIIVNLVYSLQSTCDFIPLVHLAVEITSIYNLAKLQVVYYWFYPACSNTSRRWNIFIFDAGKYELM